MWTWYGHFTFRGYPHPESADKVWRKYVGDLNRQIFGKNFWKRKDEGVTWARGLEYQKRGSLHYHAIIGCVPDEVNTDLFRLAYKETWNELAGFARVYPYERNKGAEFYMSKSAYAWKRGEIDLGGPLKVRMQNPSLPFGSVGR